MIKQPRLSSRKTVAERISPSSLIGSERPEKHTVQTDHGRSRSECQRPSRRPQPIIDYRLKLEPVQPENLPPVTRNITIASSRASPASSRSPMDYIKDGRYNVQQENDHNRRVEKEEAEGRIEALEQKIQWWADCTSAWRTKYQAAKAQRNELREHNRKLQAQLGIAAEDTNAGPKDKSARIKSPRRRRRGHTGYHMTTDGTELIDSACQTSNDDSTPEPTGADFDLQSILRDLANVTIREPSRDVAIQTEQLSIPGALFTDPILLERGTAWRSSSSGGSNRDAAEELQKQLTALKIKHDLLEKSDQENVLQLSLLRVEYQMEMDNVRLELENELAAKGQLEIKVAELRYKVEDWQQKVSCAQNQCMAAETEKLSLERETRRLRNYCDVLQSRIQQLKLDRRKSISGVNGNTFYSDAEPERQDLRHDNQRLQKNLQDQMTELGHAIRRLEHYESEVACLRSQISLLNQELTAARQISDDHASEVERQKALNQDLQDQLESMQIQLARVQTRLEINSSRTA
ncbi:coiled-coil domain-containing protein 102A-like [Paramacrobiotus metropolitanus]|uniref:coiled-coil domain-containing protein 102A-like n=1 Tax=Paramacrobiotus metropolitanus TaxID=2943436 RepID=UPI0024462175|nr:coiled-coil domain-containing protein 102A-like [Paramacrobiotus metropolitanus]